MTKKEAVAAFKADVLPEVVKRYGEIVVRRPDPQALWPRGLEDGEWSKADLTFVRDETSAGRGGKWITRKDAHGGIFAGSTQWSVRYEDATFIARPTPFKHVGIFPEQAPNWDLVRRVARAFGVEKPRLLNLFGYTGVASVLALRSEYEVTHVDASKTSLAWARENLAASGFPEDAMKIVLDDALVFTQREARRGSRYHVVLLDPPHYGRGPRGEKWQFEDSIGALVAAVRDIVLDRALVILSSYAIGCSPITLENLLADLGPDLLGPESNGRSALESGELVLREESPRARLLPAGFCARWSRGLDVPGA
jgi:23S rRNA (cytosine1962-C5)-methyltransferase